LKLLHVLSTVNPVAGGPREGVCRRGVFLEGLGHSVSILTLDDPNQSFLADVPLTVHAIGPSMRGYGYNKRLVPWLLENAGKYDAIIVNGLWQYHSFGTWRALRKIGMPYFLFVHGMLDPWFKHTYPLKHLKKWLYWPWGEYRVVRDARAVLFTSEDERRLARQSFWLYRAKERVVAYGTSPPPGDAQRHRDGFFAAHPALRACRIFLFLGRIHEKKGCDLLIEAFAKVAAGDGRLRLVMAGPAGPELLEDLKALAARYGISDRVSWPGMLQGDMKWGAFYSAEAFVLPSHQENFGIAVAESLGCGLPVLISKKVNIWREILADNAGLAEEDTQLGTDSLLERWLALGEQSRIDMKANAVRSFETRFRVDAMAHSLLDVIAGAPP
jgi:glycosyltransferase involved in cell wall biosynthesis